MINMNIKTWDDFLAADQDARRLFILTCRLKGMANKEIALSLGMAWDDCTKNKIRKHCHVLGLSSPRRGRGKGGENYIKEQSLCWKCSNCYGGCNWSKSFQPVEGWKAEIRKKCRFGYGGILSTPDYFVIECPEFVQDEKFINYRGDLDD